MVDVHFHFRFRFKKIQTIVANRAKHIQYGWIRFYSEPEHSVHSLQQNFIFINVACADMGIGRLYSIGDFIWVTVWKLSFLYIIVYPQHHIDCLQNLANSKHATSIIPSTINFFFLHQSQKKHKILRLALTNLMCYCFGSFDEG